MQASAALGRYGQRVNWLAVLMTLVLALSMVPISRAHADTAAAPGANFEPGTYTVDAGFSLSATADYSANKKATVIVGEDGSVNIKIDLTTDGLALKMGRFWVDSVPEAAPGTSNLQTTKANVKDGDSTISVVSSLSVKVDSLASTYEFADASVFRSGAESAFPDKTFTLTIDLNGITPKADAKKIAQVPTVGKLTYNGAEQTAIASSNAYTVTGDAAATNAGSYTATLKLAEGYEWADGTTADKTIDYTIAPATLKATYAGEKIKTDDTPSYKVDVTGFVGNDTAASLANLGFEAPKVTPPSEVEAGGNYLLTPEGGNATANYTFSCVPGMLTVAYSGEMKPGTYTVTAYMYVPAEVSPMSKNMFLTCDPGAQGGLNATPPLTPATNNATLVVADDGSLTLTVPLNSNALSLYDKDGKAGKVSGAKVVSHETGKKTYTNPNSKKSSEKDGLYTSITLKLDKIDASYKLEDYGIWMAPMGGDISSMAKTTPYAMLNVDFSSVTGNTVKPVIPDTSDDDPADVVDNNKDNNKSTNTNNNVATQSSNLLKAGVYTVTSNIFMEKANTGLPMGRAYLTSGEFPPNQPVTSNSTLVVDEQGRATVTIPLTIQVMNVKSLPGLNIVSSETDGSGYLKSVTVDLGIIQNPNGAITKSCTANVSLTDMVVEMAGLDRDQSWPATLEVNLTGVPTAAGGTVDGGFAQTGDRTVANTVNGVAAVIAVAAGAAVYARRRMAKAQL